MKSQIRILGIDDAAFSFSDDRATVVGVVVRLPAYLEGVMVTDVGVDGLDATERLIKMLSGSRYLKQLKLIALDGIALGGFNVVDIKRLAEETGVPVATVTRDKPDMKKIEKALRSHFDDWRKRLSLIKANKLQKIMTGHNPLYASSAGIDADELIEMLKLATVRGALPEALRVAHLIATGISKGESKGRA
jgi:endonuclease V-like protein UPF0215 family